MKIMSRIEDDFQKAWEHLQGYPWQGVIIVHYQTTDGRQEQWQGKVADLLHQAEQLTGDWNPSRTIPDPVWGLRSLFGSSHALRVEKVQAECGRA